MSADRDPGEKLLASISDGRPVDWDAAERAADPSEQAQLESLRELSRIADFNRALQRLPDGPGEPERRGED